MKAAHLPIAMAPLSAAVLVASGYGARFGVWDYRMGFQLISWSFYTGLATGAVALATLLIPRLRAGHAIGLAAALVIGLGVAYVPWQWQRDGRAVPPINDITTDIDNPPAFVAAIPLRTGSPVSTTYPGADTAAKQKGAFPDIRPVDLALPPTAAFARALDVAKRFGWTIAAADPASGRIEATATTPLVRLSRRRRDTRNAHRDGQQDRYPLAVARRPRRPRDEREARARVPRGIHRVAFPTTQPFGEARCVTIR